MVQYSNSSIRMLGHQAYANESFWLVIFHACKHEVQSFEVQSFEVQSMKFKVTKYLHVRKRPVIIPCRPVSMNTFKATLKIKWTCLPISSKVS